MTLSARLLVATLAFTLCPQPAAHAQHGHAAPAAPARPLDAATWRADLATLAAELRRIHPDPFAMTSEARFDSAVRALDARLAGMDDREAALGMMSITALVQDGHTGAIGLLGHLGFGAYYPLRLTVQDGALFVLATAPAHRGLVGGRITRFGDLDAADALARVLTIAAGDNDFSRIEHAPLLLMSPGVLGALGIHGGEGPLRVEVAHPAAGGGRERRTSAALTAIPFQGPPGFLQEPFGVPGDARAELIGADRLPLHMRDPDRAWWFTWLPEQRAVYFQFRRVDREDRGRTFNGFIEELFAFVDSARAEHLVIDMRHNGGGDNSIVQPLIHELIRRNDTVNRPGHLYTIIGRETFSAAMNTVNWLEEHTETRFVGEPTGARPNHFGDATTVTLPASGMPVRISRYRWAARWPWDERMWIAPHLPAPPDVAALAAGRDPALEAIEWSIERGPIETQLEEALRAGRNEDARALYAADRARFPDRWGRTRIGAMRAFAERLFGEGQRGAALEMARIQTEVYPESAAVWTSLGMGLFLTGDRAGAVQALERALTLDPGHGPAQRWLERAQAQ